MPTETHQYADILNQRTMLVKKCTVLPVEAIVRGYITGLTPRTGTDVSGSGWKEYRSKGTVHGIQMPKGLQESQKLEKALFTPSTKAEQGQHDENIHPDKRYFLYN
jgi:phosphoribosylaminoimidazole-succinocarboxamide synthase